MPLHIAIAGLGLVGLRHAKAMSHLDGVTLCAVADPSTESSDQAAAYKVTPAFALNDAVEMAEHLRQNGFSILLQTKNYYANLSSRFDLPNKVITRLNALNILYDEDETGSFLHFYSTVFGNGQFFEFVERRDGYDGFGAPNARFVWRRSGDYHLLRADILQQGFLSEC